MTILTKIKANLKLFLAYLVVFSIPVIVWYVGTWTTTMPIVVYHEHTHQEIYRTYDIESTIKIDYLRMGGVTRALVDGNLTYYDEKCIASCLMSQDLTEIVGYHLLGLVQGFWILVLVIMEVFVWYRVFITR
jgi:hypothetical protein